MVEDKRMLVGVFKTSFRFCLWGVKEEEGRGDGYIQLCSFTVFRIKFSLQTSFSLLMYGYSNSAILTSQTLKAPFSIKINAPPKKAATLLPQKQQKV